MKNRDRSTISDLGMHLRLSAHLGDDVDRTIHRLRRQRLDRATWTDAVTCDALFEESPIHGSINGHHLEAIAVTLGDLLDNLPHLSDMFAAAITADRSNQNLDLVVEARGQDRLKIAGIGAPTAGHLAHAELVRPAIG